MPFDIVDRIRASFGSANDSALTLDGLDRPDDVTVERVTDELKRAIASEDLSIERSGFHSQSDLLEAVDPIVRDYREHHEALDLLNQIQTGWESDAHRSYSDAIDDQVDDEDAGVVERRDAEVVSILKGFDSAETTEWIYDFSDQYPALACLTEYRYARSELEDRGYLG